jgi:hypothetical protein
MYDSPVERKALRVTANAQQAEIESLHQRIAAQDELLREMGEALEKYQKRGSMDDLEDADYAMDAVLAKYKGMTK